MGLLTADELKELTDCVRPFDQIAWLRERGWRFEISETRRPKVDRQEYARHMIGSNEEPPQGPDTSWYGQTQKAS